MKLLFSVVLCTLLSGCYQVVNSWDIERAVEKCNGIQNIVDIQARVFGDEFVTCKNGKGGKLEGG